jgi:hypothetical protein
MVVGEPVALLATCTLALVTAPPAVGANVTVSVADCPGVRIVPFETPLALNSALAVTPETVMLEFPLFVSVVVSGLELFTFTVPKFRLAGLAAKIRVAATPIPLKLIVTDEGALLVVRTMEPVALVVETGVKIAFSVALAPAAIVVDVVIPELLKPEADPVVLTCENVRSALPAL